MQPWLTDLLRALALPEFGLATVFVVSYLAATLLPLASEPALFGLARLNPALLWPAVAVATLGNTLGGMTSWAMGAAAHGLLERHRHSAAHQRALRWLQRLGPPACVLSFLPVVGDALCVVAGWLRLAPLRCAAWMALGKFLRYAALGWAFVQAWPDGA